VNDLKSLWVVPIRFVGETAFNSSVDAAGAFRCELFDTLTLPSLVAAVKNPPPNTKIAIVLINSSSILEPTCMRVIETTKSLLGNHLSFGDNIFAPMNYMSEFSFDVDLIYVSRFDSDDAIGPNTFISIHNTFVNAQIPMSILSPFWGNLWFPSKGDENHKCGHMIYNTMIRKYPVFQTHAIRTKDIMRLLHISDIDSFKTFLLDPALPVIFFPYKNDHRDPEEIFKNLRSFFRPPINWPCGGSDLKQYVSDCILYFNSWSSNGIPGIIYTQTGMQSSNVRNGEVIPKVKYYSLYNPKLEIVNPNSCEGLKYFNVEQKKVENLRNIIIRDQHLFAQELEKMFSGNMTELNKHRIHKVTQRPMLRSERDN
jgi:hypothetical protein